MCECQEGESMNARRGKMCECQEGESMNAKKGKDV